ncbi:integrase catalytic domain-containing protein [Trichonephila clavata]|uniref:Integrase catalytic domain-containing protein n=1 Tax=Trichonephila clavata TaxID=2740835 RepID=A0A8X6JHS8_TRICU|nr:integrase catalytic domain-containing protein [Trichonephila clavata]
MEGAGALKTNEMLSVRFEEKTKTLNRRRGNYKAKITKLQSFLKDKASNAEQLLLQSKLDKVSEMYSSMEALKIEYYEVVEDEQLPNLELILEEMEDDLEEIKIVPRKIQLFIMSVRKRTIRHRRIIFEYVIYSAGSLRGASPNDGGVINNPTEPQTVQTFSSLRDSTAIVGVWSPVMKSYVRGRVILDSASQSHFMTLQFASKLGLEKKKINLSVSGLIENSVNIKWKINDAFISNNDSSYTSPLDFLIVPRITDFVPSIQPNLKIKRFNDINRSILADPSFDKPGKIDMIIGAELFYQILKDGRKVISDNVTLINSVFGFIVCGSINAINHKRNCFLISESENIDNCIKKFWEVEEITLDRPLSKEEDFCEIHFKTTHRRDYSKLSDSLPKHRSKISHLQNSSLGTFQISFMQSFCKTNPPIASLPKNGYSAEIIIETLMMDKV